MDLCKRLQSGSRPNQVFSRIWIVRHARQIRVRKYGNFWIYGTSYVDDILIGANSVEAIKLVAADISRRCKLKVLGSVRFILGIEVGHKQSQRKLMISQRTCINGWWKV